jgi:hypothetical protein
MRITVGNVLLLLVFVGGVSAVIYYPDQTAFEFLDEGDVLVDVVEEAEEEVSISDTTGPAPHLKTPDPLKAIYMTSCVTATPSLRRKIISLIEETEVNAVVIDVKDFSGRIAFDTQVEELDQFEGGDCYVRNIRAVLHELAEKQIYAIARITVFQDPLYANMFPSEAVQKESDKSVWEDRKGISFVDAGGENFWKHIVSISNAVYDAGFDELNFDYVRYPSDGDMRDIHYPISGEKVNLNPENGKAEVIEGFFEYLHDQLDETGAVLSADLFGMTTTNTDDLNIGQVLERALPYFDFIAPMVYPSHYPTNFIGLSNPAEHPYEVIFHAMAGGVQRANSFDGIAISSSSIPVVGESAKKLRPWFQDFNLGAIYTPELIRKQIEANIDVGLSSWMMWDASNTYTREALLDVGAVLE